MNIFTICAEEGNITRVSILIFRLLQQLLNISERNQKLPEMHKKLWKALQDYFAEGL